MIQRSFRYHAVGNHGCPIRKGDLAFRVDVTMDQREVRRGGLWFDDS